jgi:hypothetical protein
MTMALRTIPACPRHASDTVEPDNESMKQLRLAPVWLACAAWVCAVQAATPEAAPTPLVFSDFYKRPIGPRGLEATDRLVALAGSRVQLRGFLVRYEDAQAGPLILAPLPVKLTDEDESLADDLPASIAYVQGADARLADLLRRCTGPVEVTGVLEIGPRREPDERTSFVRLAAQSAQCAAAAAAPR